MIFAPAKGLYCYRRGEPHAHDPADRSHAENRASARPLDAFTHAVSFVVNCDDQAEIDRLWDALSEGGAIEMCGWLKDRYGLSWQIVPTALGEMMRDPDRERARRVTEVMLAMKKIDIARLEDAYGKVSA